MSLDLETKGLAHLKLLELMNLGNLTDVFKCFKNTPPMSYILRDSGKRPSRIDGLFLSSSILNKLEKGWKAEMLDLGISDHNFITIKAMSDRQSKMKNLIFENNFLKQKNEIRACIKNLEVPFNSKYSKWGVSRGFLSGNTTFE